jgi:predicted permease
MYRFRSVFRRDTDDLGRDLLIAARQFRRSPGFVAAAVSCLALGIGATTTIVSVVNTIVLRPLPYEGSARLVRVVEHVAPTRAGGVVRERGIPLPEFLDWKSAHTLSETVGLTDVGQQLVRTSQGVTGLWGMAVTSNTFTMLGVSAALGRPIVDADASQPNVVVLAHSTWLRHFDGDPGVVGSTVELHGGAVQAQAPPRPLTVVGVLPADFQLPIGHADFYVPLQPSPTSAGPPSVTMIGRLAPGVSLEAATAEVNALGGALRPPWPATAPALAGPRFELQRLQDIAVADMRPALRIFVAAVVLVLLIVCANVATLLLARGVARQREMAVRVSLGATPGRLVRQTLTECLLLAAAGGAIGAALAAAGVATVKRLATVEAPGIFGLMFGSTILPRAHEVHVDTTVLGIALVTTAITSVVFGLLPAAHLSRVGRGTTVGSARQGIGTTSSRTRTALVVGQVALATVLLVGAGLLIHSFVRLAHNDKGYDGENVVALQLLLPRHYSATRRAEVIDTTLSRLRQLPGVQAAGFARHGVLIGEELTLGTFVPAGKTLPEMRDAAPPLRVRAVSRGFLTAMGVSRVDGREFEPGDTAHSGPVVVVNRTAARLLFGTERAVGQVADWHLGRLPVPVTVVGVVDDVRQESLAQERFPEAYVEYRQLMMQMARDPEIADRQEGWAIGFLSFAIRTTDAPEASLPSIARLVRSVDPDAGIDALVPLSDLVASSIARERFVALLFGAFALVAAVLAAIGVYGVLAFLVAQRTAEIGVRMALGAPRRRVLGMILSRGLLLTAAGIAAGLAGAVVMSRFLQGMLFGVTPVDVTTFSGSALLFGVVTMAASYVPARRATRIDPLVALRSE